MKKYIYQIEKNNIEKIEEAFQLIKAKVMEEWGMDEDDMMVDSIEDEVNSESKDRFQELYGFEY